MCGFVYCSLCLGQGGCVAGRTRFGVLVCALRVSLQSTPALSRVGLEIAYHVGLEITYHVQVHIYYIMSGEGLLSSFSSESSPYVSPSSDVINGVLCDISQSRLIRPVARVFDHTSTVCLDAKVSPKMLCTKSKAVSKGNRPA